MKKLNLAKSNLAIAYFGTPYFSARFLEKLITDVSINQLIEINFVVTQPDKPVGRKQVMTPSLVKELAKKAKIPVLSQSPGFPFRVRRAKNTVSSFLNKIDLALVFAYGQIIPKKLLDIPECGFWCIHPSLLPKYRGASPIAFPLILGDTKTGVTIFKMDEKIDHGPIVAQQEMEILPTDKRPNLEIKLTELAYEMFKKTVIQLTGLRVNGLGNKKNKHVNPQNTLTLKPQNHSLVTYARYLIKDDGFIPLSTLKKALRNEPLTFEELPKIIKEYLIKQKTRLSADSLTVLRTSVLKLDPSENSINPEKIFVNSKNKGVDRRGVAPLQPDLTDPAPHWRRPTQNPVYQSFDSARIVYNLFRGLYPWPGIWTILSNGKRLKITNLEYKNNQLVLKKVHLEGKKEVDFETFNQAYRIF